MGLYWSHKGKVKESRLAGLRVQPARLATGPWAGSRQVLDAGREVGMAPSWGKGDLALPIGRQDAVYRISLGLGSYLSTMN